MVDNRNGDPWYELVEKGASPEQIKWAEEQMRQGKPYLDGNGNLLKGPGWSTSLTYADNKGGPAPGKQDRLRPIRDPDTLEPVTLGNAQYPPGNRLTPNAAGYSDNGTLTGEKPLKTALDAIEKAAPGYTTTVTNWTPTRTKFNDLNGSNAKYASYTARFRPAGLFATAPRGVDPGLVYRQPGVDPWAGMRGPAGGRAPAARPGVMQPSPQVLAVRQALQQPATSQTYQPTVGGAWGSGQNTGPGSPGWSPGVITHDWNTTSTAPTGTDLSFATRSQQTSSRWNTDY